MLHDLTLEGHGVRLVPLADEHAGPLSDVVDAGLWAGMSSPTPDTPAGMRAEIRAAHETPARLAFAVLDTATGAVRGSTSFYDFDTRIGRVEIGHTYYDPRWWGTANNPACKLLMLTHAFETWGCARWRSVPTRATPARSRPSGASAPCPRASCAATACHRTALAATVPTSRSCPTSGPRSEPAWRRGSARRGEGSGVTAPVRWGLPERALPAREGEALRGAGDPPQCHRLPGAAPASRTRRTTRTRRRGRRPRRPAPRRGVHAVRDGPREPERLGRQGGQVDGVPVAGDGGVPAADRRRERPAPRSGSAGRTVRGADGSSADPARCTPRAR